MEQWVSVKEASACYDVQEKTIHRWIANGDLIHRRVDTKTDRAICGRYGFRYQIRVDSIADRVARMRRNLSPAPIDLAPPPPAMAGKLLSVREVSAALSLNRQTVERWCREGRVECYRSPIGWRIPASELRKLQRRREHAHCKALSDR